MDTNRLILQKSSPDEVIECLGQIGVECVDRDVFHLLKLISLTGDPDDQVTIWTETPDLPPGTRGFLLANTFCNINVKRTSIIMAAIILDALLTNGLATAALHLGGSMKRGVAKIDPGSGEYCCLVHAGKARDAGAALTPDTVQQMISGKPCPFIELNCRLMRERICGAQLNDIDLLFQSLEEKGALERNDGNWIIPL
jgi:hypothetical protein